MITAKINETKANLYTPQFVIHVVRLRNQIYLERNGKLYNMYIACEQNKFSQTSRASFVVLNRVKTFTK